MQCRRTPVYAQKEPPRERRGRCRQTESVTDLWASRCNATCRGALIVRSSTVVYLPTLIIERVHAAIKQWTTGFQDHAGRYLPNNEGVILSVSRRWDRAVVASDRVNGGQDNISRGSKHRQFMKRRLKLETNILNGFDWNFITLNEDAFIFESR